MAASPALTAKDAKELLHALRELPDPWTVADSQLHSRFASLAGVIALRRAGLEKGSGAWKEMLERAGIRMPSGLYQVEPSAVDWDEALRIVNRFWDFDMEVTRAPDQMSRELARSRFEKEFEWMGHDRDFVFVDEALKNREPPQLTKLLEQAETDPDAKLVLTRAVLLGSGTLDPSLVRQRVSPNDAQALFQMGLMQLALAAYRADRGFLPSDPGDLVPEYLSEVMKSGIP